MALTDVVNRFLELVGLMRHDDVEHGAARTVRLDTQALQHSSGCAEGVFPRQYAVRGVWLAWLLVIMPLVLPVISLSENSPPLLLAWLCGKSESWRVILLCATALYIAMSLALLCFGIPHKLIRDDHEVSICFLLRQVKVPLEDIEEIRMVQGWTAGDSIRTFLDTLKGPPVKGNGGPFRRWAESWLSKAPAAPSARGSSVVIPVSEAEMAECDDFECVENGIVPPTQHSGNIKAMQRTSTMQMRSVPSPPSTHPRSQSKYSRKFFWGSPCRWGREVCIINVRNSQWNNYILDLVDTSGFIQDNKPYTNSLAWSRDWLLPPPPLLNHEDDDNLVVAKLVGDKFVAESADESPCSTTASGVSWSSLSPMSDLNSISPPGANLGMSRFMGQRVSPSILGVPSPLGRPNGLATPLSLTSYEGISWSWQRSSNASVGNDSGSGRIRGGNTKAHSFEQEWPDLPGELP